MESVKYKGLPRVVPWATEEEWKYVWSCLFAPVDQLEAKYEGVCLVKAWRTRGKLPHAIDATCDLVDAMLSDFQLSSIKGSLPSQLEERPSLKQRFIVDECQLRHVYALSLIRFVNGFADSAQKSQNAKSVYQVAQQMGIPSWFVDLRHASTHEPNLPMLTVLRSAVARALNWMEINYWKQRQHDRVSKPERIVKAMELLLSGEDQDLRVRTAENFSMINKAEHAAFLALNDATGTDMMSEDVIPVLASFSFLLREPRKDIPLETACKNRWSTFKRIVKRVQGLHTPFLLNLVVAVIDNALSIDVDYVKSNLHGEVYRRKVAVARGVLSAILQDEWVSSLKLSRESLFRRHIAKALKQWKNLSSEGKPHLSAKCVIETASANCQDLSNILCPCIKFIELCSSTGEILKPTGTSFKGASVLRLDELETAIASLKTKVEELLAQSVTSVEPKSLPMFSDSSAFDFIEKLPEDVSFDDPTSAWRSLDNDFVRGEHIPGSAIGSNPDGTPSQLYKEPYLTFQTNMCI